MNVANEFNKIAKDYDNQRKKLIPVFDDFYEIAIESIEITTEKPKVLEIGAGTGLFSQIFLNKFPNAKMDLVDLALDMLNIAKERFSTNINLNFYLEDIFDFSPKKQYDLVISSLAIHHLELMIRRPCIIKWLKNAGFSKFDCLYKVYCFGVLWAKK